MRDKDSADCVVCHKEMDRQPEVLKPLNYLI